MSRTNPAEHNPGNPTDQSSLSATHAIPSTIGEGNADTAHASHLTAHTEETHLADIHEKVGDTPTVMEAPSAPAHATPKGHHETHHHPHGHSDHTESTRHGNRHPEHSPEAHSHDQHHHDVVLHGGHHEERRHPEANITREGKDPDHHGEHPAQHDHLAHGHGADEEAPDEGGDHRNHDTTVAVPSKSAEN